YHAENQKGKAVKFFINLNKVEEPELQQLTEEFNKPFAEEEGYEDGMRAEVRKNKQRELKGAERNPEKSQAIESLVKSNYIDEP
ncbi:trigger factor, partial [Salmonella enterica subsp. enterica serovar Oslo]|nr:trigger factor [Salmonella enterica subsp. enterica serovar Oslo]